MFEGILCTHIIIVINEIIFATIVRRIDIDDVNSSGMGLFQQTEGMQIIALKDKIIEIILPSLIQRTGIIKKCAFAV